MSNAHTNLRAELIQVAALAVAAVEDIDKGSSDISREAWSISGKTEFYTSDVLDAVFAERVRQDKKWGPQHKRLASWLLYIGEELGECCKELGDNEDTLEALHATGNS